MPFWTKPRMALLFYGLLAALSGILLGNDVATGHPYRAMWTAWQAGFCAGLLMTLLSDREPKTAPVKKATEEEAYWSALLSRSAAPKKPGGF